MSSLTNIAQQTKAIAATTVIMIVTLTVGYYLWVNFKDVLLKPPPPPTPNYGFGALPPLVFPENNTSNYTYRLETPDLSVPSLSGYFMPVYLITSPKVSSGFFSLDRAKQQASGLGFILEPELMGDTEYRWTRTTPIPATLDFDRVKNRFKMKVSWETDPTFQAQVSTPTEEGAISEIKSILRGGGFLAEDLDQGVAQTTLLAYSGGEFIEVPSLSETEFIQVDLFRAPIIFNEKIYPILPVDPTKGLASGMVSSSRSMGKRIVSLDYYYYQVDYLNPKTYPFITGDQAWQMLQNGQGYVAVKPSIGTTAVIREVEVAYYDYFDLDQPNAQYLQPIYVFKGDNDFVAYVPALAPHSFQQTATE